MPQPRTFRVDHLSVSCQAYVAEVREAMAADPVYREALTAWARQFEEGVTTVVRIFADHDSLPFLGKVGRLVRWLPRVERDHVAHEAMVLLEFEGGGRQVFRTEQVVEVYDGDARAVESGDSGSGISTSVRKTRTVSA